MRGGVEGRTRRIAAWDLAAAASALMALGVMALSPLLYALLPIILLSALVRFRLPGRGAPELVLSATSLIAGALLAQDAGLRNATGILAPVAAEVLLGALLLMTTRLYLDRPRGGDFMTLGIGLAGVTAAGSANLGWAYPALGALFLVTGLHGLRAREHARTQPRFPPLARLVPGTLFLTTAAMFSAGLGIALPHAYGFATERFVDWARLDPPRVGFTEGPMFLGAMEGMWESDEVVLRVFGEVPPVHLRGSVHTRYRRGHWAREPALPAARSGPMQPAASNANRTGRIEFARRETGPLPLPLGARPVDGTDTLQQDGYGIVRAAQESAPRSLTYRHRTAPVAAPGPRDLLVPEALRAPLAGLLDTWQVPADNPPAAVRQLVHRLESDFRYSQHYRRTPGRDPLLDFLLRERRGHCEYFASALVLLARSAGVPARVIRGYRGSEYNPVGRYLVVRESNAHAWAELYLQGRWTTWDPAPPGADSVPQMEKMSAWRALFDLLSLRARGMLHWASTQFETLLGVMGMLVLAIWAYRSFFPRRWRRRHRDRSRPAVSQHAHRLPAWDRLLQSLAGKGLQRSPTETLESFLNRATRVFQPAQREALLRAGFHYAALRYGNHAPPPELENSLEQLAANLQPSSSPEGQ